MRFDKDHIQPNSKEIETIVLGSIIQDNRLYGELAEIISHEDFYDLNHYHIAKAAFTAIAEGQPFTDMELLTLCRKEGISTDYFTELSNVIRSGVEVINAACKVNELAILRHLIKLSHQINNQAFQHDTDPFQLIDYVVNDLTKRQIGAKAANISKLHDVAVETYMEIEKAVKSPDTKPQGLPTLSSEINRLTGGWMLSEIGMIAARPGEGKCLGKGTKVLMYDGSLKKVEDIIVGDKLMGIDSTPRNVLSIARGIEQMYWIRQNKAMDYRVNESHILSLRRTKTEGNAKRGDIKNIALLDYLANEKATSNRYKGYKMGFELPEKPVKIDPYLLGLWLGDGSKAKAVIHNSKEVIRDYVTSIAGKNGYNVFIKKQKTTNDISIHNLMQDLKHYGLYKNKHIPDDYLMNSREVRMQLLAGLIDTDGYKNNNGYIITQKIEMLAQQIKRLADGLGFRTSITKKTKTIKSLNFSGTYYDVGIYGHTADIPCKVDYKKAIEKNKHLDFITTGISVEKDIVDEYYGFEIDGDRLFMLEDGTVTHNTAFMIQSILTLIQADIPCGVISLEMNKKMLMNRIFSNLCQINGYHIRDKKLNDYQLNAMREKAMDLMNANVFISDDVYVDEKKIRPLIRSMVTKHKVKAVFIDYFQLVEKQITANEVQANERFSRTLQKIAREFEIAIICLTQLSRNGNQRPTLENLRGGGLEQAPALVIGLHDESYQKEGEPMPEIDFTGIILKSRYGSTGDVRLHYNKMYQQITDTVQGYQQPTLDHFQKKKGLTTDIQQPNKDIF